MLLSIYKIFIETSTVCFAFSAHQEVILIQIDYLELLYLFLFE